MTNFWLDFCIRLKFQNCQISSALDLLMRPAGMVFQWTQFPDKVFKHLTRISWGSPR